MPENCGAGSIQELGRFLTPWYEVSDRGIPIDNPVTVGTKFVQGKAISATVSFLMGVAEEKNTVRIRLETHLTCYVAEHWQCFQNQEVFFLVCSAVLTAVIDFSIFPIGRKLLPQLARPSLFRDISWSICFPTRTTGAIRPRGSKIELIVTSIPLQVHGLSFNSILNLNASDSMHHSAPNALSIGNLSLPKSRPLISFALS